MRARRTMRVPTVAKLAVGASVLAFPATAVAFTNTGSDASSQPAVALHAARTVLARYGHRTTVRGTAPLSTAGLPIQLRYRPANALAWRTVARGRVHANGRFALTARVARSGGLQVVAAQVRSGAAQFGASAPRGSSQATAAGETTSTTSVAAPVAANRVRASAVRHVTVRPELSLSGDRTAVMPVAGQVTQIRGHLLPGIAGRRVVLDVENGHRWVRAGAARTQAGGAFDFHYVPVTTSSQHVHVAFAGDRINAHAASPSRAVIPMQYAEVSWYDDAGSTACGFHATYGIASRTLACGSKVTLSYGGRSVVATVDDRGPFVYSRLYDLNQTTAGALGMSGVATVLASI